MESENSGQGRLLKIARLGHPVLRQVAAAVSEREIKTPAFSELVDDMIATMREYDGVGLAAPQIFISKRVIVVEVKGPNPRYPHIQPVPLTVLINPEIVEKDDAAVQDWEGCLSIPDFRGKVPRSDHLRVKALDPHGSPIELDTTGFFARVIQHEIDHLDGIVFLDRMVDLKTLSFLSEFQRYSAKPA